MISANDNVNIDSPFQWTAADQKRADHKNDVETALCVLEENWDSLADNPIWCELISHFRQTYCNYWEGYE